MVSIGHRPQVLAVLGETQDDPVSEVPPGIKMRHARTVDEVEARVSEADAIVFWEFRGALLREVWVDDLRLTWIHVAGAGVNDILFPKLVASPVTVTNSRGVFDAPVAEYVISLICAVAKRISETVLLQSEARWVHRTTTRLEGSYLVVVGPGGIGTAVAKRAGALGMRVVGIGRSGREGGDAFETILPAAELTSQVAMADHVVVAAPLTPETHLLFDEDVFGSFRGATLINVGRGEIIDEEALLGALDAGRVRTAALDVFHHEPLPPLSPLWDHPKVIVSPHMAGDVPGIMDDLVRLWLDNLKRWLDGKPLMNVVSKDLGFVSS